MVNSWIQAVAEWRKTQPGNVLVPKKGTEEYNKIRKIQEKYIVAKETKALKKSRVVKRESVERKMGLKYDKPDFEPKVSKKPRVLKRETMEKKMGLKYDKPDFN